MATENTVVDVSRVCNACGKHGDDLKRCKACKSVWYCDGECQKSHWPTHRPECAKIRAKAKAASLTISSEENGPHGPSKTNGVTHTKTEHSTPTVDKTKDSLNATKERVAPEPSISPEASDKKFKEQVSDKVKDADAEAAEILNRGLDFQRNNDYEEAFQEFSKGIAKYPEHYKLFEARALSAMLTGRLDVAEKDANRAVELDPKSLKAKIRLLKVLLRKGHLTQAVSIAEQVLKEDPTNAAARADLHAAKMNLQRMTAAESAFSLGKFREAAALSHKITDESPGSRDALMLRARCLVEEGELDDAYSLTTRILRDDEVEKTRDHALLNLRAKILFGQERFDQSMKHLQEVLRENPDDSSATKLLKRVKKIQRLKTEGDDNFKASKHTEAYEAYSACLSETEGVGLSSFRSKLFCNRAAALSSLNRYEEAILDCDQAIALDEKYIKAYSRRALCLRALGGKERIERAVFDYEKIEELQGEPTSESRENIKRAKQELKLAKRKNYYALLGITTNESAHTVEDIKKAYKRMALKYHPDRHTNSTEEERKQAEATFKDVAEALHVLGDPERRRLYDRGMDFEEIEQHGGSGGHGHSHGHGFNPYDFDPEMFGGGHPFGGFGRGGGFGGGGGFRQGGYPF